MIDVMAELTKVFQSVFENDDLQITSQTTAADVAGWDSLMHVRLMLNVERAFGIRFKTAEIAELKDVGELASLVEGCLAIKARKVA